MRGRLQGLSVIFGSVSGLLPLVRSPLTRSAASCPPSTLVFGGRRKESKRRDIIAYLEEAIAALGLDS